MQSMYCAKINVPWIVVVDIGMYIGCTIKKNVHDILTSIWVIVKKRHDSLLHGNAVQDKCPDCVHLGYQCAVYNGRIWYVCLYIEDIVLRVDGIWIDG